RGGTVRFSSRTRQQASVGPFSGGGEVVQHREHAILGKCEHDSRFLMVACTAVEVAVPIQDQSRDSPVILCPTREGMKHGQVPGGIQSPHSSAARMKRIVAG